MNAGASSPARAGVGHCTIEDVLALVTGALFVSFGVVLYREAGLLTGGTAGLAFLAHYAGGGPFGLWFLVLNLPFFAFAARRMGPGFALKTLVASCWCRHCRPCIRRCCTCATCIRCTPR